MLHFLYSHEEWRSSSLSLCAWGRGSCHSLKLQHHAAHTGTGLKLSASVKVFKCGYSSREVMPKTISFHARAETQAICEDIKCREIHSFRLP